MVSVLHLEALTDVIVNHHLQGQLVLNKIHVHQTHVKTTVNVYQMVTDLYVDVHQDSVVKDVKYVIHAHQIQ